MSFARNAFIVFAITVVVAVLLTSLSSMNEQDSGAYIDNFQSNELTPEKIADSFDFPVGPPDAKGYYNAQPFGENNHLGDDWNAITGGNSDYGDPIYAIANGVVTDASDHGGGWGNVIRIVHKLPNNKEVESLYAHCSEITVEVGDQIVKGKQIGNIGDANGAYTAHLHFEIRSVIGLPLGPGYASNKEGYLDPTEFINNNR